MSRSMAYRSAMRLSACAPIDVSSLPLLRYRPNLAQPSATSGAPARLVICVLVGVADHGQVLPNIARQVRGHSAVDLRVVGRRLFVYRFGLGGHLGLATIDQFHLRRPLFAGRTELGANAAQQLQFELVDHQLEQCHLAVARRDEAQQFVYVLGWLMGRRHALEYAQIRCLTSSGMTRNCQALRRQIGTVRARRHAPVDAFKQHRELG